MEFSLSWCGTRKVGSFAAALRAGRPGQTRWYDTRMRFESLPGHEYIRSGIEDLGRGVESVPALLVSIGAPRLRQLGLPVPDNVLSFPEHRLYELLRLEDADAAHSRYNALIRRLVSFERAAACEK